MSTAIAEMLAVLRINDTAPDFTAETTQGTIHFHEWIGAVKQRVTASRSLAKILLGTIHAGHEWQNGNPG